MDAPGGSPPAGPRWHREAWGHSVFSPSPPGACRGLDKLAGHRREGTVPSHPHQLPSHDRAEQPGQVGRPNDRDAGSWAGTWCFRAFSGKASSQRGGLGACPHGVQLTLRPEDGPPPCHPVGAERRCCSHPERGPPPCGSHAIGSLRTDCTGFSFHPQQMRVQ